MLDRDELAARFAVALARREDIDADREDRYVPMAVAWANRLLAALSPPVAVETPCCHAEGHPAQTCAEYVSSFRPTPAPEAKRPTHVLWTASGVDTTTPRRVLRWEGGCPIVGLYNSRTGIDESKESAPIEPGGWVAADAPPAPVQTAINTGLLLNGSPLCVGDEFTIGGKTYVFTAKESNDA